MTLIDKTFGKEQTTRTWNTLTKVVRAALTSAIGLVLLGCRAAQTKPAADGDRPPKRLAETPAEFPGAFTVIRAVMALPDGRLVVSDPQENRVHLLDFSKGTSRQLGRTGEGPREYRKAGGLYRTRGGGVLLFDQELRRLLPVSPSGRLQDVVAPPTLGPASSVSTRGPDPLSADSLGNVYAAFRLGGFTATSSLLVRYRGGARPDTVARLLRSRSKLVEPTGNKTEYQEVLFSPQDAWTVGPDGRIALVRAVPYHVEWIPLTGPTVTGPAITHKPVPVTQVDKDLIASGKGGPLGRLTVSIGMVPPGGPPPPSPSGARSPVAAGELLFAEVKAPVNIHTGHWPLLDESGRLWVERSLPAGAMATVFDVFDRAGNLADRIELPAGSRLIGFDSRWLYAVRIDADDLEHLRRFPLPR